MVYIVKWSRDRSSGQAYSSSKMMTSGTQFNSVSLFCPPSYLLYFKVSPHYDPKMTANCFSVLVYQEKENDFFPENASRFTLIG